MKKTEIEFVNQPNPELIYLGFKRAYAMMGIHIEQVLADPETGEVLYKSPGFDKLKKRADRQEKEKKDGIAG